MKIAETRVLAQKSKRVREVGELDGDGVVEVADAPVSEVLVVGLEQPLHDVGLYLDQEAGDGPGRVDFLEDDQGGPAHVEGGYRAEGQGQRVSETEGVE